MRLEGPIAVSVALVAPGRSWARLGTDPAALATLSDDGRRAVRFADDGRAGLSGDSGAVLTTGRPGSTDTLDADGRQLTRV